MCCLGKTEILRHLLEMEVDISAVDQQNNTALHLCCEGHCTEESITVIRILLEAGINGNIANRKKRKAFELLKHTDLRMQIFKPEMASKVGFHVLWLIKVYLTLVFFL